jgi:hypothetical protein
MVRRSKRSSSPASGVAAAEARIAHPYARCYLKVPLDAVSLRDGVQQVMGEEVVMGDTRFKPGVHLNKYVFRFHYQGRQYECGCTDLQQPSNPKKQKVRKGGLYHFYVEQCGTQCTQAACEYLVNAFKIRVIGDSVVAPEPTYFEIDHAKTMTLSPDVGTFSLVEARRRYPTANSTAAASTGIGDAEDETPQLPADLARQPAVLLSETAAAIAAVAGVAGVAGVAVAGEALAKTLARVKATYTAEDLITNRGTARLHHDVFKKRFVVL